MTKSKTDVIKPRKKKVVKNKWKFEIGDKVVYIGGLADKIYTNQNAIVTDRSRGKVIEYYTIKFDDGSDIMTKYTVIKKRDESEEFDE